MVRFIVEGPERTDQAGGFFGFASPYFDFGFEVENTTGTGYEIIRPPLDLPFPIPTEPSFSSPPEVYSGTGLTYQAVTHSGHTMMTPITGTITGVSEVGDDYSSIATGMNVAASDYYAVTLSANDDDNHQMVADIFQGNDLFRGGTIRDDFDGHDGNDRAFGRGGNDRLWGSDGDDKLSGGGGRDRIEGGAGNDILKGGGGRDVFVFDGTGLGRDRIKDFRPNKDQIVINHEEILEFSDLNIRFRGGDTFIRYDGNTIVIEGIRPAQLDADDFSF